MADDDFAWAIESEGHLATNKAGGSARAQAEYLRAKQRIRTAPTSSHGVRTDERAYRLGAVGEEIVGRRLATLDRETWLVLHDIMLNDKGTNLDHLVIGPPGVFSINTKHRPRAKIVVTQRTFRVNEYRVNYLPVAVDEAKKVARILGAAIGEPIDVTPAIAVVRAQLEVRSEPGDVIVVGDKELATVLTGLPKVLSPERRDSLMRVAGRPSTWNPPLGQTFGFKPWRRYGLKRLYVNDPSGKSLGFRDEVTGEVHADDPADHARIAAALTKR